MNRQRIIHNMPAEEYHRGTELSNSSLHILATKTPAHYDLYRNGLLKKITPALELGINVHAILLEPERFAREYIKGPDVRRNSKEWKEFAAEHGSKNILKPDEFNLLQVTRNRVCDSCSAADWLLHQSGETEVSVFWKDKMTGLSCRCRPDKLIPYKDKQLIVDIKTCRDASPEGFEKSIRNYGYTRNCAFYRRGVEAVTGQESEYLILAIETPAMIAAVYEIDHEDQISANIEIDQLLAKIKECEESRRWPGYSDKISTLKMRKFK